MATVSDGISRKPGRPRSAQAHQAILNAALEEVAEVGVEAMSIEGVAARAGVGKTTIYRRWPSKNELIKAAVDMIHIQTPIPDTGHLRDDVFLMVHNTLEASASYPLLPKLFFRALSELRNKPEILAALQAQVIGPRFQQLFAMFEHAKARGEMRPDLDPFVALGILMGPIISFWLLSGILPSAQPPADLVEQIVDTVLQGLAPQHPAGD